jgi:hypothetical protein
MKAVLNRGNLILGVSWALAIGMFLNRAGKTDAPTARGAKGPRVHAAQASVSAPAIEETPVEVPVSAEPVGEALSRNDSARPLP